MKHLKTILTGLFLLFSAMIWAEGPSHANAILREDSAFQSMGVNATNLEKYGIKVPWYQRLEYGLKIGFNFTPNGNNPTLFINPLFGPVFGGTLALPFSRSFGIRLEALYSQAVFAGVQQVDQPGTGQEPSSYIDKLSYIDVPLMLRIRPIKRFGLGLIGGGDFAYLVGNKYKSSGSPVTGISPSSTTLGYIFGIEYTIYEITGTLRITGNSPDNGNLPTPKAMVGQFTIAFTFPQPE
jgi:Outer membrane protein beta-barrel domain